MATLFRVNGLETDDPSLSVLSAHAVETAESFRVEAGALRLSTTLIPKGKRLAWRIGLTREEAIRLARARVERACDIASETIALNHSRLHALTMLAAGDIDP
jgi:hypothetical protein